MLDRTGGYEVTGTIRGAAAIFVIGALLAGCAEENASEVAGQATETNPLEETVAEQEQKIKELEEQLVILQETIHSQEIDLQYAKDEAAIYRGQVEGLVADMSDSEQTAFAKSQWTYELTVNGEAVPAEGEVKLDDSQVEVAIVQKQAPYTVLPQEIFSTGKISGQFHEHVKPLGQKPDDVIMTDGTVNTGVIYTFSDVPEGEAITISVTEELKGRVDLNTDQLRISVNGD
ncbi:Med9 domain-containing protein [Planococcus lenghuensis]|uniref:Uncharacterized protein n=1 Tax=Planococcus lenghuensis TaxID=2213202 RepID=A0A1Q2KYV4_9BACL|nr:hypothetical protein [Planococcus lenghuensis]AQQ53294.1 hypothetical protein B0X71_09525 [Planococcus lenghuensis]